MTDSNISEFGKQIKERRLALGISQRELCRRLGWTYSRVCEIEGGRRKPKIETFQKIMDVMK